MRAPTVNGLFIRPLLALATALFVVAGCGGSKTPPSIVSLSTSATAPVMEADNPMVTITATVDRAPRGALTVPLNFAGTATRDQDYAASGTSISIAASSTSGSIQLDIYRDLAAESNETISISLGTLPENAEPGMPTSVEVTITDGGGAEFSKTPMRPTPTPTPTGTPTPTPTGTPTPTPTPDPGMGEELPAEVVLVPTAVNVTDESVNFGGIVINPPSETAKTVELVADYSTDFNFESGVMRIGAILVAPIDPNNEAGLMRHVFNLPVRELSPNNTYAVRLYVSETPGQPLSPEQFFNVSVFGFATRADGKVATSCRVPSRMPDPAGGDPLFSEQWHLTNTGQKAFAMNGGVAGADLRMADAISNGHAGRGVKIAIVDSGLEICHPDLAANVEPGKSYNFSSEGLAGSSPTDPFNFIPFGDHGTSVAGVAAAVANNGFGGRGVAAEAQIRGFFTNLDPFEDPEAQFLQALGGSSNNPDSASAHIFNMSFGVELPSQNSMPDFLNLFKMGATMLRGGLGAFYVKAAGNEFRLCRRMHPLSAEVGCIGSNSDPDQNLPYLVNVGAFNAGDKKSSYSSAGSNLWVVAPAGEDGVEHPGIITTDQIGVNAGYGLYTFSAFDSDHALNKDGDYVADFGGTSAAAPAASGAIAVLLGVNPQLTWRDVKHILAKSARKIDPDIKPVRVAFNGKPVVLQHGWQANAAQYNFHNWYGFGAIDIDSAVSMAQSHTPNSLGQFTESSWFAAPDLSANPPQIPDNDGGGTTHSLDVSGLPDGANIEAVVLEISVNGGEAWDYGVQLTSPGGTESMLNTPYNSILEEFEGLNNWHLLSNAFYGEAPNGTWRLKVVDLAQEDTGTLEAWRLRIYYGDHP